MSAAEPNLARRAADLLLGRGPDHQAYPVSAVRAQCPPPRMQPLDADAVRASAALAGLLYPGIVGKILARELVDALGFGYLLGAESTVRELMRHLDEKARRQLEVRR